ncbi:MAG: hypothetical protein U0414_26835 [Polyangiaceae bacterium]
MNAPTENRTPARNEFVQSLVDLGTEWVALGISFGTQALERSAKSLELAARSLDTISKGLERRPRPTAEAAKEDSVEVQAEVVDEKS